MSETDTTPRFDLALDAEANEIETIRVEVKPGVGVDFPVLDEWPVEASDLLSTGQLAKVLDLLFEDDSEGRAALRGVRIKRVRAILEALAARAGVEPGEASGSAS